MGECKKCAYFAKSKPAVYSKGSLMVGFCNLRQKHITDASIGKQLCKDKAII